MDNVEIVQSSVVVIILDVFAVMMTLLLFTISNVYAMKIIFGMDMIVFVSLLIN